MRFGQPVKVPSTCPQKKNVTAARSFSDYPALLSCQPAASPSSCIINFLKQKEVGRDTLKNTSNNSTPTMEDPQIFLPGDIIPTALLPTGQKRKLGHGIHQDTTNSTPEHSIYKATLAGPLQINQRKKTATIQPRPNTTRYQPKTGDLVIAQLRATSQEHYHLHLSPHSHSAILHHLNFEGATKKTRPKLDVGDLVYAKVVFAGNPNMEIEISCVNPQTGKAEPDGLGPLSGGMVFDVCGELAERVLGKEKTGVEFLEELGGRLKGGFEICIGRNGRVWVDCGGGEDVEGGSGRVRGVCAVGRCLREVDGGLREGREMDVKAQKKMVNRVLAEYGLG